MRDLVERVSGLDLDDIFSSKPLTFIVSTLLVVGCGLHLMAADKLLKNEHKQVNSAEDRALFSEMIHLDPSPLLALEYNKASLLAMGSMDVGKITFNFDDGASEVDASGPGWYLDKIGKYYKVHATIEADLYQQLYILKTLQNKHAESFLIEKIEADSQKMILTGRVYGTAV